MSLKFHDYAIGFDHILFSLQGVEIFPGETVALAGPNGCGKSTLLKTMGGHHSAKSGSVTWENKELKLLSSQDCLNLLSQHFSTINPYGELTVQEVVEMLAPTFSFGGQNDPWKVQDLLCHSFSKLSDGQRQKVMLTGVLARDCALYLLDEPTTHLDFESNKNLSLMMQKLVQNNKIVLFASHDWHLIKAAAHRVIYINENATIEIDTPEKIFQQKFANDYKKENIE